MKRDSGCTLCRLHKTCKTVCLIGSGPKRADVMIVGEAPGKTEDEKGKPFIGASGAALDEMLEEAGIDRDKVFVTNAVLCRPPDNRTPTKAEIRSCRQWLDYQIKHVKPKYVLLLGNVPLQSITGKSGIKKRRGRPFEQDGITFLPTFHPAATMYDPSLKWKIQGDLTLFKKIIDEEGIPREKDLDYIIVDTKSKFRDMIKALVGVVSLDIETSCLYPWAKDAQVKTIGFGTKHHQWIIPVSHKESPWSLSEIHDMLEELDDIIPDLFLVAQNGKFDFLWLWVHFGVRWYPHFKFDTMLAHYALDENSRHDLKLLAQIYYAAPDWDIDLDKKQGQGPLSQLALYQAHDLYYTRRLFYTLSKKLRKDTEVNRVFEHILMACARLFVEVEYDGVCIDTKKMSTAEAYLRTEVARAEKAMAKYGKINWGSPQQVAKLFFTSKKKGGLGIEVIEKTKGGAASTSESVIKRIDHPVAGELLKFRGAKQQLSFFIDGWKPFLHKTKNGIFLHPSFKLHGTVTGRLSCEHPNLQQVPRDERIRSLITAPDGWTLVECDLSQIELRIAAELAQERSMLEAFAKGIDVHWLTCLREIERGGGQKELVLDTARTAKQDKKLGYADAIDILLQIGPDAACEIRKEWKELRKKAKAINFGYLYGMWWKKFKIYARDNYGVNIDDEQAQDSRKFFFDTYDDYPRWHEKQRRYARMNGYVRSLSGRKRRLPDAQQVEDTPSRREAERQAINSPVQSFANEINLMAAIQLRQEFGRNVARICGTVHDSVLLWVKNEHVEKVTTRLLKIMTRPRLFDEFDIELSVPVLAEAKIGPWGQGIGFGKWKAKHGHI